MAKKKKITRKELLKEPDEFLTLSSRLFGLAVDYRYHLAGALAAILTIVAAITIVLYYTDKTSKEAFAALQQYRTAYAAALQDKGPQEAYQQVQGDFEKLLDKFGSKEAGKLGRLVYADISYRGGDSETAIKLYHDSVGQFSDPYFKNQIYIGLGYAYEAQNNLTEAVKYFEMVDQSSNSFQKGEALYNLGRLYAAMGQAEKSMAAYKQIVSEDADSIYIDLVKERIGS